ncbi:hypothetical protein PIB30_038471 [Stylosanthes scabra]|uniref:Uncharacterized protein n=1 Tax=Stylosanthes scabra TaxID=79078 RepID=A0ABU6ZCH7_9FABA|nr:hypothetical protein [Stylosanthes scabra]
MTTSILRGQFVSREYVVENRRLRRHGLVREFVFSFMARSRETRERVFDGGCFDKEEALVEEVRIRARSRKPTMYTWQVTEVMRTKTVSNGYPTWLQMIGGTYL